MPGCEGYGNEVSIKLRIYDNYIHKTDEYKMCHQTRILMLLKSLKLCYDCSFKPSLNKASSLSNSDNSSEYGFINDFIIDDKFFILYKKSNIEYKL